MRPEQNFIAERRAAQHCPELLRPPATTASMLPAFAEAGAALACSLSETLAPLLGVETLAITAGTALESTWTEATSAVAPLAANSLFATGPGDAHPLVLSLDAAAVLRMIDRAFGGRGAVPAKLPRALPPSAELMIAQIDALFIAALTQAFPAEATTEIRAIGCNGNIARLASFAATTQVAILPLEVEEVPGTAWTARLIIPLETLALLAAPSRGKRVSVTPGASSANQSSFGTMPLTLSAILVDMAVPVSLISMLEPGQVLPVSVARSVPLRIGATTIAQGTVGALDDRVAVQLSNAFWYRHFTGDS